MNPQAADAAGAAGGKKGSHGRDREPKPPASTTITGLIGIDALACHAASSSDEVLAVLSFLLVGMAGSEAWLGGEDDGAPLAKLDLLVRRRDRVLQGMTGQLAARIRVFNRSLAAGMEDYTALSVGLARRGAFAGGPAARFADPEDTRLARERLTRELVADAEDMNALIADMRNENRAIRIEALLHPQFLLESVRCRELDQALDQCHQRTAIVLAPKTDPDRSGSEPVRDLKLLLELMEGLATPNWPGEPSRTVALPLKAHVLLDAGDADLELMARALPEMPARFLWLAADGPDAAAARRKPDPNGISGLMGRFNNAATHILGQRRAGKTVSHDVADGGASLACFRNAMRRYRRWIGRLALRCPVPPGPGPVVAELPGLLYWGLGMLCLGIEPPPNGMRSSERLVMAAAFRSARRLARRHCRELALFLNAERLAQALELARQVVANLDEKGPLSQRELVRCFSNQRKERFEPVLGAMLELGVLVREDGKFAAGDVEISEVEDGFRQALVTPAPARVGLKNASHTKPPAKTRVMTQVKKQATKQATKQAKTGS